MSATVISLTERLNSRRATAEVERRREDEAKRDAETIRKAQEPFQDRPVAAAFVGALVAEQLQAKKAEDARPAPAYCDPTNEFRGSKYEATRNLSLAETAKRIRADIKAAVAAGTITKGVKVSVTTKTYSGGGSIDVRVTAVPEGFRVLSEDYATWRAEREESGPIWGMARSLQDSAEWVALRQALEAIHGAYNRDNSDSMTDYFDRRYYGTVSMEWQLRETLEAADIERARGALEEARAAAEIRAAAQTEYRSPWYQIDLLGAAPVCETDLIAGDLARAAVAQLAADGWDAEDIAIEHGLVSEDDRDGDAAMWALYFDLPRAAWEILPDLAQLMDWRAPMTEVKAVYERRPVVGAQLVQHAAQTCPADLDGYDADAHPDAAPDVTRWQSFAGRHGMSVGDVAGPLSVLSSRYLARREQAAAARAGSVHLATAGDLDASIGARAYYAMSHSPERRAEGDIAAYVAAVNGLHAELLALAQTDEQRAAAREQVERYRQGYIRHQGVMWAALSRCMSPMIVGPARFPVDRNRKRMDAHGRRVSEFLAWDMVARRAARKAVLAAEQPARNLGDTAPADLSVILEADGVQVIDNRAAERVQIIFANIPEAALRDRLKGSGWHWSPRNKAWQRKNTEAAKANAAYVLRPMIQGASATA